jgi:hypothetical protein
MRQQIEFAWRTSSGFSSEQDPDHHAHGLGDVVRGQDNGLHLRGFGQPAFGTTAGEDKTVVSMNLPTDI